MKWPFRWWEEVKEEQRAISFQDFWGTGADVSINAGAINVALTHVPVFAATRLIADSIASLPLQAYRQTGDARRQISTPSLFMDPSMFGGPYEWVQRALVSLLLRGNAYGLITSTDRNGYPQQLEWLHPDDVTISDDRTVGKPQWYYLGRPVDPWLGRDSVGQLLHIAWYVLPGRVMGVSPIRAFAQQVESGLYAQKFGRDFFSNGAVPSSVLESDQEINQEQAKMLKERFRYAAANREPVALGVGTKYKAITVPPEESQFLESIRANATTIANIYGVPPEMIGGQAGSNMTYANVEQQSLNLVTLTLRPPMAKLEQAFSSLLPRPQYVRFNLDALLRADTKTRYETHEIALRNKFATVDEVRELEDEPPLTDEQKAQIEAATTKPATPPAPADMGGNVIPLPQAGNQ